MNAPLASSLPSLIGLSWGEFFMVAFVTGSVLSARHWPALGARIAVRLAGGPERLARPKANEPPHE